MIIDDLIAADRGRISGTAGDSVLAEFASVVDAVHCAVAIQQALAAANAGLPPDAHGCGFASASMSATSWSRTATSSATASTSPPAWSRWPSRAASASRAACATMSAQAGPTIGFEDLGEQSVKNIARPVRAFRILFDPDGTTELREIPGPPEPSLSSGVAADLSQDAIELEFWQSVQASGEADEYGAYLERYPDGIFAPLARDRLAKPETLERPPAPPEGSAVELAFWDTVKDSDNPAMFRAYLEQFPAGIFKALADIRLAEIDDAQRTSPIGMIKACHARTQGRSTRPN